MEFKRWRNLGEILPEEVEEFVSSYSPKEEVLREIEEYAKREKVPILLPSTAQALRLIVSLKKPRKVLEVGTGIGYSTLNIYFAHPEAQITTVDSNAKRLEVARELFKRVGAPIKTVRSDGLDFIRECLSEGEEFDLIFVDSAKGEYPFFHYKVQALLKEGGVAIFDNALFRGYAAGRPYGRKYERGVKLLKHFLKTVKEYPNFRAYLIPVGDGLLVLEKLL
jgi:predicted O-methyltransferase YrrM